MGEHFPKSARLRRPREFQAVESAGKFAADQVLVVKGIVNGTSTLRLGIAVGRQAGNAVLRNRWKRLIREAFRRQYRHLPSGFDIVVKPRRGAIPDGARLAASLLKLTRAVVKKLSNG